MMEILSRQARSYMCSCQGNVLCFTIDFGSGFTCSEGSSKVTFLPKLLDIWCSLGACLQPADDRLGGANRWDPLIHV